MAKADVKGLGLLGGVRGEGGLGKGKSMRVVMAGGRAWRIGLRRRSQSASDSRTRAEVMFWVIILGKCGQ